MTTFREHLVTAMGSQPVARVALRAGISASVIHRYLRGDGLPTLTTLTYLIRALDPSRSVEAALRATHTAEVVAKRLATLRGAK